MPRTTAVLDVPIWATVVFVVDVSVLAAMRKISAIFHPKKNDVEDDDAAPPEDVTEVAETVVPE
jgi:hypothetical protein